MLRLTTRGYEPHPRLWVIATYFNVHDYQLPRRNFRRFLEPLVGGGVNVVIAEGRGPDGSALPTEWHTSTHWVEVDCDPGLWQKERLLNVALEVVPDDATAIAWLDGDVLFGDPCWIPKAVAALDAGHRFVQPFDVFMRLPRESLPDPGIVWNGYGGQVSRDPACARSDWSRHGHTGLAWVGQADLITRSGFYDRWLAGTGDHLMAHAMTSTADCSCTADSLGADSPCHRDFLEWAADWASDDPRAVGFLPGAVFHLWHGESGNRRYREREAELRAMHFDPSLDLDLTASGGWRASQARDDLSAWGHLQMATRRDDG